jgi:hypothetical protein
MAKPQPGAIVARARVVLVATLLNRPRNLLRLAQVAQSPRSHALP